MDELKIEVAEALVIKPGDRVLLLADSGYDWTNEIINLAQTHLRERFPDTEFAFITGVGEVVLERQTCQDNPEQAFASDTHLHECGRELGHRSRVHRCACGCEWWQPAAEEILAGEG